MVRECSDLRWGSLSQASRSGHLDSVISIQLSRPRHRNPINAIHCWPASSCSSCSSCTASIPLALHFHGCWNRGPALRLCCQRSRSEACRAAAKPCDGSGPNQAAKQSAAPWPLLADVAKHPVRGSHFFTLGCWEHWLAHERPPGCYLSDLLCAHRRWRFCLDDPEPAPTRTSCCGAAESLEAQSPSRSSRAR